MMSALYITIKVVHMFHFQISTPMYPTKKTLKKTNKQRNITTNVEISHSLKYMHPLVGGNKHYRSYVDLINTFFVHPHG